MQSTSNQWSEQLLMQLAGLDTQTFPNSTLYIVGLPIGNAADITLRALWVLAGADVIAAEDTRETKKLLERFSISVPTVSVREHNEIAQSNMIIERLKKGEKVAMVTTPGRLPSRTPEPDLFARCSRPDSVSYRSREPVLW